MEIKAIGLSLIKLELCQAVSEYATLLIQKDSLDIYLA
jgi:hypothetical protein